MSGPRITFLSHSCCRLAENHWLWPEARRQARADALYARLRGENKHALRSAIFASGAKVHEGCRHFLALTCSSIRCPATDLRQFRQSRDARARSNWSRFVFIIRKTLNQRSLWYRAAPQSLGDCIAWYGGADDFAATAIAVTNRWFT
jgi:hypothetical protein